MKTFKEYCLSEAAVGDEPKYTPIDVQDAVNIILSKCSDAVWMFYEDRYIWRGDYSLGRRALFDNTPTLRVDTTKTQRKSQNTINFYTVILDQTLPPRFPKRSNSFICTAPYNIGMYGYPSIVIPFNTCKIGNSHQADFWTVKVKASPSSNITVFDINEYLRDVFDESELDTWDNLVALGEKLKNGTLYPDQTSRILKIFGEEAQKDFIGTLKKFYSPKSLGLTTLSLKNRSSFPAKNTELWVGGECIVIDADQLGLVKRLIKEKKDSK